MTGPAGPAGPRGPAGMQCPPGYAARTITLRQGPDEFALFACVAG